MSAFFRSPSKINGDAHMADNKKDIDQNSQNPNNPQHQKGGGLEQEETGGPGSREKQQNQQEDGQRQQGRENERDPQRR